MKEKIDEEIVITGPPKMSYKEQMLALDAANEASLKMPTDMLKEEEKAVTDAEEALESVFDIIIKKGSVSENQINQWLEMFEGKVFAVIFDDDEYYIYKYLSRAEYKAILLQFKAASEAVRTNEFLDELFVEKCLLFPKYDKTFAAASPAGTITSLSKQIQYSSNFIPDAYLMSLIYKL